MRPVKFVKRHIFNILGWLSFALGVIGAFLPLLPTTPLILLASFFFSKGSPKFYQWLIQQKYFGDLIRDWNEYGVVSKKSKIMSASCMFIIFIYFVIFTNRPLWMHVALGVIFISVSVFVSSRPSVRVKKQ